MANKFFTLAEARAALPLVRDLMTQIQGARREIIDAQPEMWSVLKASVGNGGSKKAGELLGAFERLQSGVRAIQEVGCVIKDLDTGLVDFLHHRNGRQVYLCWRYGEDEIGYWHDIDAGFSGRHPL